MTALPAWAAPYVGLPYRSKGRDRSGVDCWGLVRMGLAEHFGIQMPSYADAYADAEDARSVCRAVKRYLRDGWVRVTHPAAGDLVMLRIEGRPWHCALMISPTWFVHAPGHDRHGRPVDSMCESVRDLQWKPRVLGYYRANGHG